MSQENLDLIRRGYEQVVRTGELPASMSVPTSSGTRPRLRIGFNLKKCVGIDEANTWLAEWTEGFESWSLEIEEVFDAGDQVVTFVRQHARAKRGGPEVNMPIAQVWTLRDGLVARMEMYFDREEALEAAGLSE